VTLLEPDRAQGQLQRALALFRARADYRGAAVTLYIQAQNISGFGHLDESLQLFRQAQGSLARLGENAPVLWDFRLKYMIGGNLVILNRLDEAQQPLEQAIAEGLNDRNLPREELATTRSYHGLWLAGKGKFSEAEGEFQTALATASDDPEVVESVYTHMAMAAEYRQDFVAAAEFARKSCQTRRGENPQTVWTAIRGLAWARYRAEIGEVVPALAQVREDMPKVRRFWSDGSDYFCVPLMYAAHVFLKAGDFAQAERYAREALRAAQLDSPQNWPWLAETTELLGEALIGEHRNADGMRLLREAHSIYARCGPAWTAYSARLTARIGAGS